MDPLPFLNDSRLLILSEEIAERIASRLASVMDRQAHPFRHPYSGRNPQKANQYGAKGVIKFNPTNAETNAGIRQQIALVDWQSDDGMPHHCTVDVGRIAVSGGGSFPTPTDAATGNKLIYRPNAQVIYGTPGAMQEPFFIDITRGQRFTVTASYVAVTAQMDPPPNFAGVASGSIAVIGNLGVGYTPSVAPVLFTQYVDVAVPGAALAVGVQRAQLIIPEKANLLLPVRSSEGTQLQIDFLDAAGTRVDQLPAFPSGSMIAPVDLADDIYSLVLTGTNNVSNFRFVYQISV